MKTEKNFVQDYIKDLQVAIDKLDTKKIQEIINVILEAHKNNKQIFIIGNGGSASTASHFACDLGKGTIKDMNDGEEKRFRVISLTDNVATMTALGNDLSYEDIFCQQLGNLLNQGDVVIGISASGNSPNIVKTIKYAKEKGATTIGLLGFTTGGKLSELVDYKIIAQDNHYGRSEDIHMVLCHLISYNLTEIKRL